LWGPKLYHDDRTLFSCRRREEKLSGADLGESLRQGWGVKINGISDQRDQKAEKHACTLPAGSPRHFSLGNPKEKKWGKKFCIVCRLLKGGLGQRGMNEKLKGKAYIIAILRTLGDRINILHDLWTKRKFN